jgi:hypothetical protein
LFRLRTAEAIIESVAFHNTGPNQVPGLIVMSLSTTDYIEVVVMFNADIREHSFELDFGGAAFDLHPMQQSSADPVVRSARFDRASQVFTVPPRSTAVFMRTSD